MSESTRYYDLDYVRELSKHRDQHRRSILHPEVCGAGGNVVEKFLLCSGEGPVSELTCNPRGPQTELRKEIFEEQWTHVEKLGVQVGQHFGKGTICVSNAFQKTSLFTQYNHHSIPLEGKVATGHTA